MQDLLTSNNYMLGYMEIHDLSCIFVLYLEIILIKKMIFRYKHLNIRRIVQIYFPNIQV